MRIERGHNLHVLLFELLCFLLIVQEEPFTFLWVGQQSIFTRFCFHNFSGVGLGFLLIRLLGVGLFLIRLLGAGFLLLSVGLLLTLLIGILTLALSAKSL